MSLGRVLVVDDDEAIRTVIAEALRGDGFSVFAAATLSEQAAIWDEAAPDVLVTDVVLPDGNGLDGVPGLLERHRGLPVIVLSAQNTLTTAVRATEQGAFEYLPKPFDLDELCRTVRDAIRKTNAAADERVAEPAPDPLPLIGRSAAMQDVYRTIARVVANDLSVLILGESGTGKELVARAIHDLGARKSRPFVAVNMAAIPRDLIEAELFGHERGAFTGAQARLAGRFEQASGGTLFLDEIGDMPLDAQTRLLRVLQSGEFTTVGGNRPIKADVRILAATHKNLPELIQSGAFREDLYYRLNVIPITLPPLRQRAEDVILLARHFLEIASQQGMPRKMLDESGCARLLDHDWPGNVRELENLMRRLTVLSRHDVISAPLIDQYLQIPAEPLGPNGDARFADESLQLAMEHYLANYFARYDSGLPPDGLYHRLSQTIDRPVFKAAMAAVRGNQIRAAKLLGINRNTLRKRLDELGIDHAHGRPSRQTGG